MCCGMKKKQMLNEVWHLFINDLVNVKYFLEQATRVS